MKNKIAYLGMLLPLLVGCVQTKIIDELTLISVAGIDFKDDKMQIKAIYNNYLPGKTVEDNQLEITINKDEDILSNLDRQASMPVLLGDIDVVIMGMKVAEEGVYPIVDSLQRQADIGSRLYLALTEEPISELLSGKYGEKGNAQYISNMIEHNIKLRDIPRTNLHLFASDFFQKGKGAYLPIIKKLDEDKLQITGLGIFEKQKLVHKIQADRMFYFKLLVDKHIKSSMSVKLNKQNAAIQNIKTKSSITADYDTLTVQIDYKLKGLLKKYTGKEVTQPVLDDIKKSAAKKMEKEVLKLLKEFQEMEIDPVGIERKFRQQNRDFDSKRWKDQYKDVKFKVNTKVIILESGTLE